MQTDGATARAPVRSLTSAQLGAIKLSMLPPYSARNPPVANIADPKRNAVGHYGVWDVCYKGKLVCGVGDLLAAGAVGVLLALAVATALALFSW